MVTEIWAHRGASAVAPENTIAAFLRAIQMGADGLELDVHESADGQLVVIHDARLERTTNGTGRVVDHPLAAIKALEAKGGASPGASIPTLCEVYELVRPTGLTVNVEIKCDEVIYWGIWEKLISLEQDMGMAGRILYSSFNHYALAELKKCNPKAKIGLLYANAIVDPWIYAKYVGANAIHPHYLAALQCPGLIEGCKANNVAVHPWTADDPKVIGALVNAGVEAIITNTPDVALSIRGYTNSNH